MSLGLFFVKLIKGTSELEILKGTFNDKFTTLINKKILDFEF
ncbi:MAG: hypothetical protein K0Q87_1610 [Neobacillus sp.]|nr:hypothetical protein [Neobacillus sp.]